MDALVQTILSRKGNGNGKLVFCNFRGEIDELARRLKEGGIQKVGVFDGRVTGSQREAILKGGNEVIILQIQTGCEGLNLQEGFSEIYFSSPNWNPAIEDQAIARCHRIGQSKPVSVYRFVMEGFDKDPGSQIEPISIEMHICNTQTTKREIMFTPHDKMTPKK
jgi:SNF2 family DNA or RNA helicase